MAKIIKTYAGTNPNHFGMSLELRKIYKKGEKFYGKVLVRNIGCVSGIRITLEHWQEYK